MSIIVTGAASGIGRATAQRLAKRAHVIVADRDAAGASAVADELTAAGFKATAVEVDVTSKTSVDAMAAAAEAAAGPINALFSNAGINRRNKVDAITEDDWDLMMATHVRGAVFCIQAVLPGMVARAKGSIVITSSDFAVMGVAGLAAYTAAKTALYSLTKSLAAEFAPAGVRVNAVGPGPIDTALLRSGRSAQEFAGVQAKYAERLPLGRLGRPEEVAVVVDYLLSDRAAYISGQLLHPNGGQLMW